MNNLYTTLTELRRKPGKYGTDRLHEGAVLVTRGNPRKGFNTSVYEFVDDPETAGLPMEECRLIAVATDRTYKTAKQSLSHCIRLF